jgi:hypothetical protein
MPYSQPIAGVIRVAVALLLAGLAGCAGGPQLHDYGFNGRAVELKQVPAIHQEGYQGGPAALAMMLGAAGAQVAPEQLVGLVFEAASGNSPPSAMRGAAPAFGRVAYELKSKQIDLELVRQIQAGNPVLVLLRSGMVVKQWQYAVVFGVDPAASTFSLRSGTAEREVLSFGDLLSSWKESGYWAMLVVRPGDIPPAATVQEWLGAAQRMEQAGKLEAAIQAYAAISQHWAGRPEEAEAWGGLGRGYYALHNPRGATTAFHNAISLQPNNPAFHHGLALALMDRQCADQAEDEADLAVDLEHDPNLRGPYLATQKEAQQHSGPSVTCSQD